MTVPYLQHLKIMEIKNLVWQIKNHWPNKVVPKDVSLVANVVG